MNPLKILYVTNMYPWEKNPYYGIFVSEQIQGLQEFCHIQPEIIFINGRKWTLNYLFSIFKINWHLLTNRYDIIHIHYGLSSLFTLFNPFIRTPMVLTLHSGDIDPKKQKYVQIFISKLAVRKMGAVIILNQEMESTLRPITDKLITIPCGVDTGVFQPVDSLGKTEENSRLVVFPANRNRTAKNYPLFEEVIEILRTKYRFNITTSEVKDMTREQVSRLFCAADCVLMTSFSEGSPQVIKEAMSCNAPVVSTVVGDVDHLLEGVANCYLAPSGTAEELALKVKTVLENSTRTNGRDKIFALGLDKESTSIKVNSLYQKLIRKS